MAGDELSDLVRKQVEEIMGKLELQRVEDIPMGDLLRLLLSISSRYETIEDMEKDRDVIIREFTEIGFPDMFAEEIFNKAYEIFPTKEMKTKMNKAVDLAKIYLLELADEVKNGKSYLITKSGEEIEISAELPQINGDAIEVAIYLTKRWIIQSEGKIMRPSWDLPSGLYIIVELPLEDYKINIPAKESFRKAALEEVFDNFVSKPLMPYKF